MGVDMRGKGAFVNGDATPAADGGVNTALRVRGISPGTLFRLPGDDAKAVGGGV